MDAETLSGICGSISIVSWIVVFTPQIVENFRRSSADGLSLTFVAIWLTGDIFNILGAIMQRLLPTMIVLALYYTAADLVLLAQCLYYRSRTRTPPPNTQPASCPSVEQVQPEQQACEHTSLIPSIQTPTPQPSQPHATLRALIYNTTCLVLVCMIGIAAQLIYTYTNPTSHTTPRPHHRHHQIHFDPWGQFFGYLCALLYLASRLPQIILNFGRKSTEGISILFFLFACLGNITYVVSIMAVGPKHDYRNYFLVNLSWLIGSGGTLILDFIIFAQFWIYRTATSPEPCK